MTHTADSLRAHLGEAFCTIRPSTVQEQAEGMPDTFGGAGLLVAVHDEDGVLSVETDYGMAWAITPDTVMAFAPVGVPEAASESPRYWAAVERAAHVAYRECRRAYDAACSTGTEATR